jgi:hypothetical protein
LAIQSDEQMDVVKDHRRLPGEAFVGSGSWASPGFPSRYEYGEEAAMARQQEADPGPGQNGHEEEVAGYEQELAGYLQERIKPGLNSGAIPLLARSIAKEIAHREHPNDAFEDAEVEDGHSADEDDEHIGESDDEHSAEADDEDGAEADDGHSPESEALPDFEADMHELQVELGEDWILSFSVQGDDAWLTAEKDDGSQRVEAPTASVLSKAVGLLNEDGGRSS